MATLKCKMCGGNLEIIEGTTVCECEYCGTTQTVPKVQDDVTSNLFNRANNLRMKSEFDKAQEIYEKIVSQNENESEAYWGIVLCKFGIEYVEDPATFKKIPTCHRTQLESVLADVDYLAAIEHADISQKTVYEDEAKEIDKLQHDILEIVHKEEPFDVFICYKETDENGKRTQDSVIANDIYHQLTQEGLKVFYAAITLEDKLGQEYEPYIFAALTSAKVLLAIGTKPEYFSAVWVKNEWSRYLKLMKNDRSKLLIPCYKDMDAYDLPEEFSHLQAQDMGKIGFINDLIRGVNKVLKKDEPAPQVVQQHILQESVVNNTSSNKVKNLIVRGNLSLENEEWNEAMSFFEEALNEDATDARLYIGKIMAEHKLHNEQELVFIAGILSDQKEYKTAIRFADEEYKKNLESYRIKAEKLLNDSIETINRYSEEHKGESIDEQINKIQLKLQNESENIAKLENNIELLKKHIDSFEIDIITQAYNEADNESRTVQKQYDELKEQAEEKRNKMNSLGIFKRKEKALLQQEISDLQEQLVGINESSIKMKSKVTDYKNKLDDYYTKKSELEQQIKNKVDSEAVRIPELNKKLEELQKKSQNAKHITEEEYKQAKENIFRMDIQLLNNVPMEKMSLELQLILMTKKSDVIKFGNYNWYIIEKSETGCKLLCKDIIAKKPYNKVSGDITWENCTLRSWLNDEFYNSFSEEEKAMMVKTKLSNPDNAKYGTDGGNDTEDYIYLLSIEEAQGLSEEILKASTELWWMRSPGEDQRSASIVDIDEVDVVDVIGLFGLFVNAETGVRPVLDLKF